MGFNLVFEQRKESSNNFDINHYNMQSCRIFCAACSQKWNEWDWILAGRQWILLFRYRSIHPKTQPPPSPLPALCLTCQPCHPPWSLHSHPPWLALVWGGRGWEREGKKGREIWSRERGGRGGREKRKRWQGNEKLEKGGLPPRSATSVCHATPWRPGWLFLSHIPPPALTLPNIILQQQHQPKWQHFFSSNQLTQTTMLLQPQHDCTDDIDGMTTLSCFTCTSLQPHLDISVQCTAMVAPATTWPHDNSACNAGAFA